VTRPPIERLHAVLLAHGQDHLRFPRTAKLLRSGTGHIAKKVAEEAVEVALDAVKNDRAAVISESADLLYQLVALWVAMGIWPVEVWEEIARREDMLGIAEKLPKGAGSTS
jgi:phosphoribosyl-ATP pyrophosphohydrolase